MNKRHTAMLTVEGEELGLHLQADCQRGMVEILRQVADWLDDGMTVAELAHSRIEETGIRMRWVPRRAIPDTHIN